MKKRCTPCEGGVRPLAKSAVNKNLKTLKNFRLMPGGLAISAHYRMKNFLGAISFMRKIALLAEKENHHPDLHLTGYRHLTIELSTHSIGGLSMNDFILAGKIEKLGTDSSYISEKKA